MTKQSEQASRRTFRRTAFTLVELLVVISIIALLMAILVPSLSKARDQSKVSVCLSNLRQIGIAIHTYADQHNGAIPRGPTDAIPYYPEQGWDEWATNQVWIGEMNVSQGLGAILKTEMTQPRAIFCPADDSADPIEELEKIERKLPVDAFSSYLYRQRDQATRDRLESMGLNGLGFAAKALALDINSSGPGDLERTNHRGERVNILFIDGHGQAHKNPKELFSLRAADYMGFPASIERRLNEIVVTADYAESSNPSKTPKLP